MSRIAEILVLALLLLLIACSRPIPESEQNNFPALQAFLMSQAALSPVSCRQSSTGQGSIDTIIDNMRKLYGFQVCVNLYPIPLFTLGTVSTSDYANLLTALQTFQTEMARYPSNLLRNSRLKMVSFPTVISVPFGGTVGGFAPTEFDTILVRLQVADLQMLRTTIHHELFHNLDEEYNGPRYYTDTVWRSYNYTNFSYDCNRATASAGAVTLPSPGFLNTYSQCAVVEDKAEVYSLQFILPQKTQELTAATTDSAVNNKLNYVRAAAQYFSSAIDASYWTNL